VGHAFTQAPHPVHISWSKETKGNILVSFFIFLFIH